MIQRVLLNIMDKHIKLFQIVEKSQDHMLLSK